MASDQISKVTCNVIAEPVTPLIASLLTTKRGRDYLPGLFVAGLTVDELGASEASRSFCDDLLV